MEETEKRRKADKWYFLDLKTGIILVSIIFSAGIFYAQVSAKNGQQDCDINDMKDNIKLLTRMTVDMDKRISLVEAEGFNVREMFKELKQEIRSLKK
jgi:peptidoglycan hydrolase CwlO-like protein